MIQRLATPTTELMVLAITAAVALQAIRGIYWFSIACLVILPPAIDRSLGWREPPPLRSVGRVVSLLAVLELVIRYRLVYETRRI